MPIVTVPFNAMGQPTVQVTLSFAGGSSGRKLEAVLSTGFSGFLAVPERAALDLGAGPAAALRVEMGDGSVRAVQACLGAAEFEGSTKRGLVLLLPDDGSVLAGLEFLRRFGATLSVAASRSFICFGDR